MEIELQVNGFSDVINFPDKEIKEVHFPILKRLNDLSKKKNSPIVCLFAAPPGTGKSTIAALWQELSIQTEYLKDIQALSIDGFHYSNQYLDSHSTQVEDKPVLLKSIKGAPETYDLEQLINTIKSFRKGMRVKWPFYDRNIHDPVANSIEIRSSIVVLEGNWVLLTEKKWSELSSLSDYRIFHYADESLVEKRLVSRKVRGGISREAAYEHYKRSDQRNIKRVIFNRSEADCEIKWNSEIGCRVLMSIT